jgi:hypothetical protein
VAKARRHKGRDEDKLYRHHTSRESGTNARHREGLRLQEFLVVHGGDVVRRRSNVHLSPAIVERPPLQAEAMAVQANYRFAKDDAPTPTRIDKVVPKLHLSRCTQDSIPSP